MFRQSLRNALPVGNPVANLLVVIVGLFAIGVSVLVGFFAFIVLSMIVLAMAAVIGLRVWWFNRKLRRRTATRHASPGGEGEQAVIEGEYRVVSREKDEA